MAVDLHDIGQEKAVVGAMILGSERPAKILRPEMFFSRLYREAFVCVCRMIDQGKDIDPLTVVAELEHGSQVTEEILLEAADYAVSASSADTYADNVLTKWRLREIDSRATKIVKGIRNGDMSVEDAWSAAGELQMGLQGRGRDLCLASDIDMGIPDPPGLPCGIKVIDNHGNLGIFPQGELSTVAARSSHGKSAYGCQVSAHLIQLGYKGMYATFEMSAKAINKRMVQTLTGWNRTPSNLLHHEAYEQACKAVGGLIIWDPGKSGASQTIEELQDQTFRMIDKMGIQFLVVDYVQQLDTHIHERDRTQTMNRVARGLQTLAKRAEITIIALAQLATPAKGEELKIGESKKFFDASDTVIFLGLPKIEDRDPDVPTWPASCSVTKNRNGTTGAHELNYRWAYTRFEDPQNPPQKWQPDPFA